VTGETFEHERQRVAAELVDTFGDAPHLLALKRRPSKA
jgi:hypothetical protein